MSVTARKLFISGFAICSAVFLSLSGTSAPAQAPRTLYRRHDIENARRNIERHEWAQRILRRWERSVRVAMQQDRSFFEDLIPELTPGMVYGQNCPACVDPVLRRSSRSLRWSVRSPDQLSCRRCRTVFPNDDYPETGLLECPRMGEAFSYYETPAERALPGDATPEERGEHALLGVSGLPAMTSMSGLIRHHRVEWAWRQANVLAKLYAVSGDPAYAERALWILDRFARVFPNYLYRSYIGSYADWPPADVAVSMGDPDTPPGGRFPADAIRHPYGLFRQHIRFGDDGKFSTLHNGFWGAGRLSLHGLGSDADPLLHLTIAYDLVRDARYEDGRPVADEAMHRRIITDLLEAGCADMDHWDDMSNKGVATRSLSAAVGLLLEQPARVRRGLDGFHEIMATLYHFDGFCAETPAYGNHIIASMRDLPDLLLGYSDPAGYDSACGIRYEEFNPFENDRFILALQAMHRMLAPGNRMPVIGNTGYDRHLRSRDAETLAVRLGGTYPGMLEQLIRRPLSEWGSEYSLWYRPSDMQTEHDGELPLRSEWFPGWHVGVLRGRAKPSGTALFLNGNENQWTLRTGHRHQDILGLSYYAFGEEMVSDRGYFSGSSHLTPDGRAGQSWVSGTLSHNLVVVDESNQARRGCGSNLELFGTAPGVEVLQASGFGVYDQCTEYRRTCIHIQTPEGYSYAVDFFRVAGGRTHQYVFHCNGEMVRMHPDGMPAQPAALSRAWNKWVENPRAVVPDEPYTFTWRHNDINLDLMLLNSGTDLDRIVIVDAPGWRHHAESMEGRPPIQQILAEKRADADEASLVTHYAAVIVPYEENESPVRSARLLDAPGGRGALAVEVRFENHTDYIVSTRDQRRREYGPFSLAGEFAFISMDGEGNVLQAYLLKGTTLEAGGTRLELETPSTTLAVSSASGRSFHLASPLPDGLAKTASYVLAGGPQPLGDGLPRPQTGYDIESITSNEIMVRDYPVKENSEIILLHALALKQNRIP